MGKEFLIDTNVVIDYLNRRLPSTTINLIYDADVNISVITRMELLASPNATKSELQVIKKFISACTIYHLEEPIILKGIEIRKHYRIKLPDAIIAATASVNDFTLLTRNMADFQKVADLAVINSWQ